MRKVKNKLIIVEGLTGLGKSTVAHFIARQLLYNGIKADWIHEGEDPHPVGIDLETDIQAYMAEALEKWELFVAQILTSKVVTVIEASFLNNLIETLFTNCLTRDDILDYGMKLQDVIRPANPALVYLTHPDTSTALEENFRNRGPEFLDFVLEFVWNEPISKQMQWNDYDGMVKFWCEFVAITDMLFQAFDFNKLSIDVSAGNWSQYNRQVTDFLSLPLVADPGIRPEAVEKYTGTYKFKESSNIYTIQCENGVLITDIFMNVKTKLIPKSESTFMAEKWHFTLMFDFDEAGEALSFTIGGRDVDYLKAVGRKATKVKQ